MIVDIERLKGIHFLLLATSLTFTMKAPGKKEAV
jgi:hypothetical protein